MLAGCSVAVSVDDAVARDATEAEVRAAGESASGVGRWTHLAMVIDRASMRRIVRWELYTAIRIEDCLTGTFTNIIGAPEVEGVALDDFDAVEALLKRSRIEKAFP